jgi:hypothetical protein
MGIIMNEGDKFHPLSLNIVNSENTYCMENLFELYKTNAINETQFVDKLKKLKNLYKQAYDITCEFHNLVGGL